MVCKPIYVACIIPIIAERQVMLMERAGASDERARWVFFRDIPSSTTYDLLQETLLLVEKYGSILDLVEISNNPNGRFV